MKNLLQMYLLASALALQSQGATISVEIRDFFFTPTNIVIQPGDTVLWRNMSFRPHDTTHRPISGARLWASPALAQNGTYSVTFNQPGDFPYVCALHVDQFRQQTGLVTVASVNVPPTVSIGSPAAGASFVAPAGFTISANAGDSDGSVSAVEFFVNGVSAGVSHGPTFSADITGLVAGSYALTAVATDNSGATSTSAAVNILVRDQPAKFVLSAAAQPPNGGGVAVSPTQPVDGYDAGTIVTLTATAAQGFAFTGWSGDATGVENPLTVTMDRARSVTAQFSAVPTFALTLATNPAGAGSIQASPAPNGAGGTYSQGTIVTLTATAADGFAFQGWSGDGTGVQNPLTVTIDAAKTVTANFSPVVVPTFNLVVLTNPPGSGAVILFPAPNAAGGKYLQNTLVRLTAAAALHFAFTGWSGDVTSTNDVVEVLLDADKRVTAGFIETTPPSHRLVLATNPPGAGTIQVLPPPDTSTGEYSEGTLVTLTAAPLGTNAFAGWTGATNSSAATITLAMDADKSLEAHFVPIVPVLYRLIVMASPTNAGSVTVTPASSNGLYSAHTLLALGAQPVPGFRFVRWSGSVTSTNNPIPLVMEADQTVTAVFEPVAPSIFGLVRGTYRGLLLDEDATNGKSTGYFVVRVAKSGAYRGTATVGGMRSSIRGQFDRFGYAPLVLRSGSLSGSLQLVSSNVMVGSLIDLTSPEARENSGPTLLLYRTVAHTNRAGLAGQYALTFAPEGAVPTGGMASLQILRNGTVRCRGTLGDGAVFVDRTFLTDDGQIPLFVPLYRNRGVLAGWIEVNANGVVAGTLHWFRPPDSRSPSYPAGFGGPVGVRGER